MTYGDKVSVHGHYTQLFQDAVVPVCSPSFRDNGGICRPEDLLALPLIEIVWNDSMGQQSPSWQQWAQTHCNSGTEVEPCLMFSFTSAALYGEGVALGQISMVGDDVKAGRLMVPFDLRLPMPKPYYLAWSATAFDKPFGREFHRWLLAMGRTQTTTGNVLFPGSEKGDHG